MNKILNDPRLDRKQCHQSGIGDSKRSGRDCILFIRGLRFRNKFSGRRSCWRRCLYSSIDKQLIPCQAAHSDVSSGRVCLVRAEAQVGWLWETLPVKWLEDSYPSLGIRVLPLHVVHVRSIVFALIVELRGTTHV